MLAALNETNGSSTKLNVLTDTVCDMVQTKADETTHKYGVLS